jgi:hypothetical protein
MARDFIGRVIPGKLCPEIIVPKEMMELAGIKGADDIAFSPETSDECVHMYSKSDYEKRKESVEDATEKGGGE